MVAGNTASKGGKDSNNGALGGYVKPLEIRYTATPFSRIGKIIVYLRKLAGQSGRTVKDIVLQGLDAFFGVQALIDAGEEPEAIRQYAMEIAMTLRTQADLICSLVGLPVMGYSHQPDAIGIAPSAREVEKQPVSTTPAPADYDFDIFGSDN